MESPGAITPGAGCGFAVALTFADGLGGGSVAVGTVLDAIVLGAGEGGEGGALIGVLLTDGVLFPAPPASTRAFGNRNHKTSFG